MAGPNPSNVYISSNLSLKSGTGPTDIWTLADTALGTTYLQRRNGATTISVVTGFDTTATVVAPTALWVGANDVYIVGSNGITLRMTR